MTSNRNPSTEPYHPKTEPVAIIGIGCRFPGAKDPEAFWQLLRDGVNAITEVPADRFDIDAVYDPRPGTPGKIVTRLGGFLEQVDHFDAAFFNISPREAARADPQHRLLLEVAWEALEDAGQVPDRLVGSQTGVFVGMCYNDYEDLQFSNPESLDIYGITGGFRSVAAGRLSFVLGLQGPSVSVDTACASSLVAVHLACQSLWSGECTLALAGGVNLILHPQVSIGFSQARMLSPDGRCKFCDAHADGFVRSEGVGVLVLKPLSLAQVDGDPIYAVIRGSAVNDDGRGSGFLMTPSREGQEEVLRKAYQKAGISPGTVHYIEAHGTGTSAGDPVEVQALGAVLSQDRPKDRPCIIGSVKTNIGHTEGASGIAGLIKVALALKHRAIPPSLHVQKLNPNIPWQDLPLVVQQDLGPWPLCDESARAGVSSFGISGTNAHVVLEQTQHNAPAPDQPVTPLVEAQLLTLSAHNPEALDAMARAYEALITDESGKPIPSFYDLCYTASVRRTHHDYRLASVFHDRQELADHLQAYLRKEAHPGISYGKKSLKQKRKIVFVFTGQGSQWVGMGQQLLEHEPVFRDALERCEQAMLPFMERSLLRELSLDDAHSRMYEVDIVQPAIFAMQVGLASLWRSWGIEPHAVVGQSMGEVAAAHVAGALSLEDAARIICRRSQLVKSTSGKGGMAVVGLPLKETQRMLSGYENRVSVAVSSSPASTVISGDPAALEEILHRLERRDIFCSLVKVDYASHSHQMEPLRPKLLHMLEGLRPSSAPLPIYSTVTGEIVDGGDFDAEYWVRNLREPVHFLATLERLLQDDHNVFLEISPHPILSSAIQQGLRYFDCEGLVLPSLQREEEELAAMLGSLASLYSSGSSIDWDQLYPLQGQCVRLPSYPWQRERFWLEDHEMSNGKLPKPYVARYNGSQTSGSPLLSRSLQSAIHSETRFWEIDLSTYLFPYLDDHRVQQTAVLPAAAYIEIALAAAAEDLGSGKHVLENLSFKTALFLAENDPQRVQLVLSPAMPDTRSFQFFSRDSQGVWILHATGMIRLQQADTSRPIEASRIPREIQARCPHVITKTEYYQAMRARGLQYGPNFQGAEQLWCRNGEAIGLLRLPETIRFSTSAYQVHPAFLDACFQVLLATLPMDGLNVSEEDTYLPVSLDSFRIYTQPCFDTELWSYALLSPEVREHEEIIEGDVFMLDENGQVILEALGLRLQRLERHRKQNLDRWLYDIQWLSQACPPPEQARELLPTDLQDRWLIFTDDGGFGQALGGLLEENGETCVMISQADTYQFLDPGRYQLNPTCPEDFHLLLQSVFADDKPSCRGIVYLWSVETEPRAETTLATLDRAQILGCFSVLHLVQALANAGTIKPPRLWLVTRGAQAIGVDSSSVSVSQAPLWGLGRVVANEHPELRCTLIDLDPSNGPEDLSSLAQELWANDHEDQIAWRDDRRHVARLMRYLPEALQMTPQKKTVVAGDQPFRLETTISGILEDLSLRATTRRRPAPGEVEIQVYAAGLNFRDVMMALGIYPGLPEGPVPLGVECVGRITGLGEGVEGFQIGDDVVAIVSSGFCTFAVTTACLVWPKPTHLSFEEAATIPIAFLTAYYALHYLGRLGKGERVLIHAASGGVGLAAIQLAQQVGAEIFATAGSQEKREFLRSLGVQHVMDSRTLAFADEIMGITDGQGVDVVLNSLAGEAISKGISILRPYGRLLEIGKRDIYQNSQLGLQPFQKNLAFFAIDLDRAIRERPAFIGSLFREVMQFFEDDRFKPLPIQLFPISRAQDAFRHMAQAKHIGKVVMSLQDKEIRIAASSAVSAGLDADSTYLITGGLGGLGLSVAQWMVELGARHLVLMGRSDPSTTAEKVLTKLRKWGAHVMVAQVDVTLPHQVADILADITKSMPPLRGIIHAAGFLDDGILLQLNQERFKSVMAPKISGAWNLHTLTLDTELDFFVMFSSAASLLGSAGQGNYVAANTFLDLFAHYRRAQGRPALSINWGPWSEVGLAAAQSNRGERLVSRGLGSITPRQGVEMLGQLLRQRAIQVGVMPFNLQQWCEFYPAAATSPLLAHLIVAEQQNDTERSALSDRRELNRSQILAMELGERQHFMQQYLEEQIAKVIGLQSSMLSKIDIFHPLNKLGIDSLMGVELKNRIEIDLGVDIPVLKLLQGLTIADLTTLLLAQLTGSEPSLSTPVLVTEQPSDDAEESLLLSLRRLLADGEREA